MILGDKIIPVDKKFKRINSEWDKKTQSSVNFGEI